MAHKTLKKRKTKNNRRTQKKPRRTRQRTGKKTRGRRRRTSRNSRKMRGGSASMDSSNVSYVPFEDALPAAPAAPVETVAGAAPDPKPGEAGIYAFDFLNHPVSASPGLSGASAASAPAASAPPAPAAPAPAPAAPAPAAPAAPAAAPAAPAAPVVAAQPSYSDAFGTFKSVIGTKARKDIDDAKASAKKRADAVAIATMEGAKAAKDGAIWAGKRVAVGTSAATLAPVVVPGVLVGAAAYTAAKLAGSAKSKTEKITMKKALKYMIKWGIIDESYETMMLNYINIMERKLGERFGMAVKPTTLEDRTEFNRLSTAQVPPSSVTQVPPSSVTQVSPSLDLLNLPGQGHN
jgi:hypothetical protein